MLQSTIMHASMRSSSLFTLKQIEDGQFDPTPAYNKLAAQLLACTIWYQP